VLLGLILAVRRRDDAVRHHAEQPAAGDAAAAAADDGKFARFSSRLFLLRRDARLLPGDVFHLHPSLRGGELASFALGELGERLGFLRGASLREPRGFDFSLEPLPLALSLLVVVVLVRGILLKVSLRLLLLLRVGWFGPRGR
jgi:hypothetical protein